MSKKIGIIVGSLRKGSFTRSIANELKAQLPEGYEGEFLEIAQLPLFDQDYEAAGATPESYVDFRKQVEACDAFIFATPEYNRSFPAAIKNALDVASRPYGSSKWNGKPAAVVSVSPGAIGGFGANHHLRQVLTFLNMPILQQPEAYISKVAELLDGNGGFKSENTQKFAQSIVDAFVQHIDRY